MIFALLTFFAAFAIESIGTVVSVIGLSALFGSNPIIIALAVALDVGKLVVVTLLYKYWNQLGRVMKAYGLIAAVVTMVITSAGASGYLSAEFQKAVVGVQEGSLKVDVLKGQIAKYEERKKQIDLQIAALPEKTSVNQRIRLMNAFKQEQQDLQNKIAAIDKELPAMQIQQIGVESKAGPILYIAKAFNISIEEAVKYVILMIIVVFDPLAVFLIVAGNFLWDQRSWRKKDEDLQVELRKFEPEVHGGEFQGTIETSAPRADRPITEEQELTEDRARLDKELPGWNSPMITEDYVDHFKQSGRGSLVSELPELKELHEDLPPAPVDRVVGSADVPEEVIQQYPDASNARVYTRDDLIAEGASDEMLIEAGYEPRTPPPDAQPKREQITLSSLGLVKPDPRTIVNEPMRAEVGLGTGVYVTGSDPKTK